MAIDEVSKSTDHVINLILNRNEHVPNYALLLGAGASWFSGVKTATEMVDIWRNQLYQRSRSRFRYRTWLSKQDWFKADDEYSRLFEYIYDEPSQRRDFIEEQLKNAHPSWGYVYLANMLEAQVFNAVLTTNFDDLLNEACYLYTDKVRPVVYAHDSQVTHVRLTKLRPKIIKLHGDFLFDSIKNTREETTNLTKNMQEKLGQFGQEYGLVVVGYSGRDESIMSILSKLVKSKDHFKHGIYWCMVKGEKPRKKVEDFLNQERVHKIEIEGFDQFMAELHSKAGLSLPESVINPMQVAERRSRIFCAVPDMLLENDVVRQDVERVLDTFLRVYKRGDNIPENMPRRLKAAIMERKGDVRKACEFLRLDVIENKDNPQCAFDYARHLVKLGDTNALKEFVESSAINEENKTYFLLFVGDDELLVREASRLLANDPGCTIARINRAIAYKRLKRIREMRKDLEEVEDRDPDEALKAGVAALRSKKRQMIALLKVALAKRQLTIKDLREFPVFEDHREDENFQKLMKKVRKPRTRANTY